MRSTGRHGAEPQLVVVLAAQRLTRGVDVRRDGGRLEQLVAPEPAECRACALHDAPRRVGDHEARIRDDAHLAVVEVVIEGVVGDVPAIHHGVAAAAREHGREGIEALGDTRDELGAGAWVHARKPQRTAWLALTGDECAPAALLTGVLAAVVQSTSGAVPTATPRTPGPAGTADPELVQRAILAVVAEAPGPTTLVIDDAHHLRAEACVGVLRTLLVGASGKLRLVLAGSHGLSELFAADLATRRAERVLPEPLAFTAKEARQRAALSDRPRDAADAALEQVWRETEGWPVPLGFPLQQRGPRSGEASPRPGASVRLLGDHLEHRVLAGLRPELRAFVLRAATCERSTARLAGELSGRDDAHAQLEECRSLGLFLDAYERDDAPVIYR